MVQKIEIGKALKDYARPLGKTTILTTSTAAGFVHFTTQPSATMSATMVDTPTSEEVCIQMESMVMDAPAAPPANVAGLLAETRLHAMQTGKPMTDALLFVMRKHHFWPALQMKKFFDGSGLVLLHNTYKRTDVDTFRGLYEECRSLVLDLKAPKDQEMVVTLADRIPDRLDDRAYEAMMADGDVCEESYEGTVVHVYEYNGKWHFGTTGCPVIDSSRYFHPTKTHGEMMDDALSEMFGVTDCAGQERREKVRGMFTSMLDVGRSYAFLLVHHENRHLMDYTGAFGPSYAKLFQLWSRDRKTSETTRGGQVACEGLVTCRRFASGREALDALRMGDGLMYGFMVWREDGMPLKVSLSDIVNREEHDLGNPNKWHNLLHVYMQNRPDYQIQDYLKQFRPKLDLPKDSRGMVLAPTYLIHTVMCTMRDILYDLYCQTTTFYPQYRRFKMNRQVDEGLAPMIRFHLGQLRHLQVQDHAHALLTSKAVYHYLCYHQTMKNIRRLINFFANNRGSFRMSYRAAECFFVLDAALSE